MAAEKERRGTEMPTLTEESSENYGEDGFEKW